MKTTPETDARAKARIQAMHMALAEMQKSNSPWQALLAAILILYTREKRRLIVSRSLIARIRQLAEACELRAMPSAFVYSLFGESDPRGFEWITACSDVDMPQMEPDWTPWIYRLADALDGELRDSNEKYYTRIHLSKALRLIPSGQ